jgi:hypothetical protein
MQRFRIGTIEADAEVYAQLPGRIAAVQEAIRGLTIEKQNLEIKYAHVQVVNLPLKIADIQAQVTQLDNEITTKEQKALLTKEKLQITATINELYRIHAHHNRSIEQIKSELNHYAKIAAGYNPNVVDTSDENIAAQLSHAIKITDKNIGAEKGELRVLHSTQTNLGRNSLLSQPESLLDGFAADFHTLIGNFEEEYPANQSLSTRIAIAKIQFNIAGIVNLAKTSGQFRRGYYQLLGMFVDLQNKFTPAEKKLPVNKFLLKKLDALLENHFINSVDQDTLYGQQCVAEYNTLTAAVSHMRDITKTELFEYELARYKNTLSTFEYIIEQLEKQNSAPYVVADARKLLRQILACTPEDNSKEEKDLKFFAQTLFITGNILKSTLLEPNKVELDKQQIYDSFQTLIKHYKMGQPSTYRKIAGALIALLGTLIVALGIIVKSGSLGVLAPVSTLLIASGSLAIVSGLGLFRTGVRKGISLRLDQLNKDISAYGNNTSVIADPNTPTSANVHLADLPRPL